MSFPPLDPGASRPTSTSGFASPPQKVRSRTQSISSDRPSTIAHSLMSPPLSVSPEAAFIAASAASQIVTNDHDSHADTWYDQHGVEPSHETALVSPGALHLVNSFLDQLLFNFLSIAQSTNLSSLRPAVSEVLKPKLAKDAVNQADEELREYLGGGDEEEFNGAAAQPSQSPRDWDLELVWKRTRLRCMVYSSLGDMEEEDEDYHMEQEDLGAGDESLSETASPAVAIFLTSILEFMGEQALVVAGQAAYHRIRTRYEKDLKDGARSPAEFADRIVVEELDMERVALDRTLGRLWRAWKKRIRSPTFNNSFDHSMSRPYSRDSSRQIQGGSFRRDSATVDAAVPHTTEELISGLAAERGTETRARTHTDAHTDADAHTQETDEHEAKRGAQDAAEEEFLAASIPLPMRPDDITEILIPGLACYSDDEDEPEPEADWALPLRPKSMMIIPYVVTAGNLPTPTSSVPQTPVLPPRKRANSLPTPATSPYGSSSKRAKVEATVLRVARDGTSEDTQAEISTEEISQDDTQADVDNTTTEMETARPSPAESGNTTDTPETETERLNVKPARRKSSAEISALIAAATQAKRPEVSPVRVTSAPRVADEVEEIDEFSEEPEILTSSRVSISGRSNSPATSERGSGRPPMSINVGVPTRTASLRVIEVSSPRSPVSASRSRGSSIEAQERNSVRGSNLSRANSVSTPPIVEEARKPSPTRKAFPANKATRLYKSDSISEAEEMAGLSSNRSNRSNRSSGATPATTATVATVSTVSTTSAASEPASEPKSAARYEDLESQFQSSQAIFGSAHRHASPPQSPKRTVPATKVTILSSSNSNGTFFFDDRPEVPSKSPAKMRAAPPPALPERSAGRQTGASTPSPKQQTTIGHVSIDRNSPRSPRREASEQQPRERHTPPRSRDQQSTRHLHDSTSSVASSQLKLKPIRASQESTSRPEDVARNFEELIQSDQTIQYTLTPESMRDIESTRAIKNDSPVLRPKSRKSDDVQQQLAERARSSSSSVNRPPAVDIKRSTSISRSAGLSSHPISEAPAKVNGHVTGSGVKLSGPIPRAPPGMAGKPRSSGGPQARDARVARESLADFADFIRATGPTGDAAFSPAGGRMAGAAVGIGGPVRKVSEPAPGRSSTASSRHRYQARDAIVDPREDSSDLIDFIRRGPPNGNGSGSGGSGSEPRIPRTVAPFRTTMDSDQFAGVTGGKAVDATIPDIRSSAAPSSITEHSVQSSINSSSALLRKDKPLPPGRKGGGVDDDDDDMMPKRKTRRVRDPYAIDSSDEEGGGGGLGDLDEEPTPRASRRYQQRQEPQEESLADFLRNAPPPPETQPVAFNLQNSQQQQRPVPKKKASAPSLMSRFTRAGRDGGSPTFPSFPSFSGSSRSAKAAAAAAAADQQSLPPASRAGGGRGYVPIQVNMPPSTSHGGYGTASGSSGSMVNGGGSHRVNGSSTSGRVPMKRFEPRDAVSVPSRGTSDLAEFLRSSEPPGGFGGSHAGYGGGGGIDQDDGSGMSRKVFGGRRKKSSAM